MLIGPNGAVSLRSGRARGRIRGRLTGLLRLEDMCKTVRRQQRKLEIACLMARAPHVLLLDEPTNCISLDVLEAFEAAIHNFPCPVLTISHLRCFIQRFGGMCWELEHGRLLKGEAQEYQTHRRP
jgi:macrolide transport system ATP-binding/permease protein